MDLYQLRYFIVTAEEESIVNASRKLFISQAALSRAISNLEKELGIPLFDRSSNRIYLNDRGRMFLQYVNRAFMELDDGVQSIRQQTDLETGSLTIAVSSSGLGTISLENFILEHPGIHVMQYIQSQKEIQEHILQRSIDLSITRTHLEDPAIMWEPLVRDEMLLFVHRDNPLSARQYVTVEELRDERFILNGYGIETADWFFDICRKSGLRPDILYAGSDTDVLDRFLQANMGISPTPALMYCYKDLIHENDHEFMKSISVLRLQGVDATRLLGMATLKNRIIPPTVAAFLDYTRTHYRILGEQLLKTFGTPQP